MHDLAGVQDVGGVKCPFDRTHDADRFPELADQEFHLANLAFLSPQLVEAILQGRQPVELTATRLTELDLPLDWTKQRGLLPG